MFPRLHCYRLPAGRVSAPELVFQQAEGSRGDAKGRKSSQLAEPARPPPRSQAHPGQLFREEALGLGAPSRASMPASERARARRPGLQAAGKPGRGAGTDPAEPGRRSTPAVVVVALAT